ncbi:MAG: hypothetical protein K8U03_06755 [Planctomycetia bacterium]|nr:hypothetical protein [Planctomycetia bacterium]
MKTTLRFAALGCVCVAFLGCKASAPTAVATPPSAFVPLPPIEREVGPGGEVVPTPQAQPTSRSWMQKVSDFCTPKPAPKSVKNRVYESDNVPYTD